ncbi:MAG: plasmid pRiA4b ORF-3 family protein [Verrucomicrobia bacterium]|nr:plasmid pRiA4b ORF-3 family protein [Verrucomicrobiota bacterium]
MSATVPSKRLMLRAVLRGVSPMVVRLLSVSDDTELSALHEIFQQVLGWSGQLGHAFRIDGQEFNRFRRRSRSKPLRAFRLHRHEKFLYRYDFLDLWEWDLRVLDIQEGVEQDPLPVCLGGRGAAPPEFCGGPIGYRLMLKRQREGAAMSDPVLVEAGIQRLAEACPDQPARSWDLLRTVVDEGFQSIDRRLEELGPLPPDRFSLKEANARLSEWVQLGRSWP